MTIDEWLIEAVKERPIIWNTSHENYKNTKLKNDAYGEIAKEYNKPVSEIKRKWHSIRSAFSRELRMRSLYTTVGTPNEKRQWRHFNKLMFLQDENQEEGIEEEVEGDYTIQLVEEDGSSSLIATNQTINLPSTSNQSENETAVLKLQNGQSSAGQSSAGQSSLGQSSFDQSSPGQSFLGQTNGSNANNKRNKKRKTNSKTTTTNGSTSNDTVDASSTAAATTSNPTNFEQILATTNYDQMMTPRSALISYNSHYSPQPLSEEEIFGHSIAASLRKFDAKQKEIVKLRLQEVIVQHLTET